MCLFVSLFSTLKHYDIVLVIWGLMGDTCVISSGEQSPAAGPSWSGSSDETSGQ